MVTRSILIAAVALMSGCASYYDKEISKLEAVKGSFLREGVRQPEVSYFKNVAIYRTRDGVHEGKEKLSNILDVYGRNISLVKISTVSKNEFVIDFLDDNSEAIHTRRFVSGESFEVASNGEVIIRSKSFCGSRDSPGVGCQWSSVKLFEDKARNLVAIQTAGGAGLVGIIPVSVGADYVSVFARTNNVPTNAAP